MNEQELGLKIKTRREKLGLSQKDLANELRLDQGKVSLIERGGRKISAQELAELAKVLKRPIRWFYEADENIPEEQDPVRAWMQQLFPDVEFTEFELRRIGQFLEPVVESYVTNDPQMSTKVSSQS